MEGYGLDQRAMAGGCLAVIVILVVLAALVLVPSALGNLQDAAAQRDYARAELERARTEGEHQASIDWQHEFMLYVVTLKAGGGDLIAVVVLGLAAFAGGYLLGGKHEQRRARG